jgi:hypothetical protein
MEYRKAPEVEEVGRELVREIHRDLLNVRIEYVGRSRA